MSRPRFLRLTGSSGFTLVEVLVTASLFSIVMSVLLAGAFTGTRAWDRADRHLERRARVRMALEQFRQDVETSQTSSAEAVGLSTDALGRPVYQTTSLDLNPGSPWGGAMTQVEWSLLEEEDGLNWMRKSQAVIGEELAGSLMTDTMLEEVETLEIELRQGETWILHVDPEGPPVDLVRLSLSMKDRNTYQLVLPIRPGESLQALPNGDDGEDGEDGLGGGDEEIPGEAPGDEITAGPGEGSS